MGLYLIKGIAAGKPLSQGRKPTNPVGEAFASIPFLAG
jgi:hypothetical protein